MSLFQCQHCGCCENTALSWQGFAKFIADECDWTGIEDRKGKKLCSACGPAKFNDGTTTECGQWHGRFPRVFLPLGMFRTARNGNLEHVKTGDQDFRKYECAPKAAQPQLQRVNVPLRLPRWMAEWIAEQCAEGPPYKTATQLIEAAMVKAYKLRPPKE